MPENHVPWLTVISLSPLRVIDPIAPRYTALLKAEVVTMVIEGAKEEIKMQPKHPKVHI